MTELRFSHEWLAAGGDEPAFRNTSAQLSIFVGDTCLTRNEDIWSKTVRDSVLVSTYPLAMWLASSWWRLNWEPLSKKNGLQPSIDWRMAHEIGAANHGFVWPQIVFASDGEMINVWAASANTQGQSVNYLTSLDGPHLVKIGDFQRSVDRFIGSVLSRLTAVGCTETELAALWRAVAEDRADSKATRVRRLEAEMGFDPEECPEEMLAQALGLQEQMGDSAMSELAPIYGRHETGLGLDDIRQLSTAAGMRGKPQVARSDLGLAHSKAAPWQQGVDAARKLRAYIGADDDVSNDSLFGLLGLTEAQVEQSPSQAKQPVAIATPQGAGYLNFVPRKRHPVAKRFECSRFLADHLREPEGVMRWLASTDLSTARQKYQRAFAAEFLCPIDALTTYLNDDFSEPAIEAAAEHFGVSEKTVESLLMNNHYIAAPFYGSEMPYRLAA